MKNKNSVKFLYHGLVLLLLGIFLYGQRRLLMEAGWGSFWPLIPFALGLLLFLEYRRTRGKALLVLGAFLAGAGAFLFLFTLEYLPWSRFTTGLWLLLLLPAGLTFFPAYWRDFSGRGSRGLLAAAVILLAAVLFFPRGNLLVSGNGFGMYPQFFLGAVVLLLFLLVLRKGKPG